MFFKVLRYTHGPWCKYWRVESGWNYTMNLNESDFEF